MGHTTARKHHVARAPRLRRPKVSSRHTIQREVSAEALVYAKPTWAIPCVLIRGEGVHPRSLEDWEELGSGHP